MKIVTTLSIAHHPSSGWEMRSLNDSQALQIALSLSAETGAALRAVYIGGKTDTLREYLGLGLEKIFVIPPRERDTAELLAGYLAAEKADLIIMGSRGLEASGLVPYLLAHHFSIPLFHNVLSATYSEGKGVATQFLPGGKRREMEFGLPALLVVHPKAGLRMQYAWSAAHKGEIIECDAEPVPLDSLMQGWKTSKAEAGRKRLSIASQRSGFERMQKAVSIEGRSGEIVKEGDVAAKAEKIIALLREKELL